MFNTLLESKPKKARTLGGTIFSVVAHVVLLTGSRSTSTAHAAIKNEKEKVEKIRVRGDEEGAASATEAAAAEGRDRRAAAAEGIPGADRAGEHPRRHPDRRPHQEGDGRGRLHREGRCRWQRRRALPAGRAPWATSRTSTSRWRSRRHRRRAVRSPRYPDMLQSGRHSRARCSPSS